MGRDQSSEKAPWRLPTRLGLLVCIVLVLVWGYSVVAGPLSLGGSPPVRQFQVKDGVFGFAMMTYPAGASPPASNQSITVHFHDTYYISPRGFGGRRSFGLVLPAFWNATLPAGPRTVLIMIPVWLPLLMVATLTGCFRVRERRRSARPGDCRDCGYNLTGNTSGKCPECGLVIQSVDRLSELLVKTQSRAAIEQGCENIDL